MTEVETLKQQLAERDAHIAELSAHGGSFRKLQVDLDAQLQAHKDKDVAHAEFVQALKDQHAADFVALQKGHVAELDALHAAHARSLDIQAADLAGKHAAEIVQLKAEVLVPAQRDLHARQLADLAAKHAAELDKLK